MSEGWEHRAVCRGADVNLFTMCKSYDSEVTLSLKKVNNKSLGDYNRDKAQYAIEAYCHRCPVKEECLDSASPLERYWTVRGGERPLIFGPKRLKNTPSFPVRDYFEWECALHGVRFKGVKKNTSGEGWRFYCVECSNT